MSVARKPFSSTRLRCEFGSETFPARAAIAFEGKAGVLAGPATHIAVGAGRTGTWTIEFTPRADLPRGSKVSFRKIENEFSLAWRVQDYWPDARDYVTVED